MKKRNQIISEMIGKNKKVIDIGCGTCELAKHLDKSCSYIGIDLNPIFVNSARKDGFNVIKGDILNHENYVDCDVIVAIDILHHMNHDKDKLIPIARKFAKRMILGEGPWTDFGRKFYRIFTYGSMIKIFRKFFDFDGINDFHDMRMYTKEELSSWFEEHGFVIKRKYKDFIFAELDFSAK